MGLNQITKCNNAANTSAEDTEGNPKSTVNLETASVTCRKCVNVVDLVNPTLPGFVWISNIKYSPALMSGSESKLDLPRFAFLEKATLQSQQNSSASSCNVLSAQMSASLAAPKAVIDL